MITVREAGGWISLAGRRLSLYAELRGGAAFTSGDRARGLVKNESAPPTIGPWLKLLKGPKIRFS
jgi:hypothetical protein